MKEIQAKKVGQGLLLREYLTIYKHCEPTCYSGKAGLGVKSVTAIHTLHKQ